MTSLAAPTGRPGKRTLPGVAENREMRDEMRDVGALLTLVVGGPSSLCRLAFRRGCRMGESRPFPNRQGKPSSQRQRVVPWLIFAPIAGEPLPRSILPGVRGWSFEIMAVVSFPSWHILLPCSPRASGRTQGLALRHLPGDRAKANRPGCHRPGGPPRAVWSGVDRHRGAMLRLGPAPQSSPPPAPQRGRPPDNGHATPPVFILYGFLERYLVQGIAAGAIKR